MSNVPRTVRWWQRPATPLVSSRAGAWFYVHIAPPIDRLLVRLSRGRVSLAVGYPTLLLTTIGAKTGQVRSTPLLFLTHEDRLVLIASNGGSPRHPGWYHNLRAHPEASVFAHGRTATYLAREATGAERDGLWRKAVALFPAYPTYQQRAVDRQIPVVVLTPLVSAHHGPPP
jgi:deazaflavin-dependent oxidoreductase (nitroreductase family)